MPQVTVWKHPRKNQYTENKYIHLNRLKTDARKSYAKKEKARILRVLKDDYKKSTPINSFLDYLKFIRKHEKLLLRFARLDNRGYDFNIEINDIVFELLSAISTFQIEYSKDDAKKVESVQILLEEFSSYTNEISLICRSLYTMNEAVIGCEPHNIYVRDGFIMPFHRNFKFEDIVELIKEKRKSDEEETIVSRLGDDPMAAMPTRYTLGNCKVGEFKLELLDKLYTERPITIKDIGRKVLLHESGKSYWKVAELICFHKDLVMVSVHRIPIGVNRNEIKNIF